MGKLDSYYSLATYTKINLKWIKDIKVKPETIKYTDENLHEAFYGISIRDI